MSEFDMIYEADMEDLSITLELEDDTVLECSVLARFPVDGQQYSRFSRRTRSTAKIFTFTASPRMRTVSRFLA